MTPRQIARKMHTQILPNVPLYPTSPQRAGGPRSPKRGAQQSLPASAGEAGGSGGARMAADGDEGETQALTEPRVVFPTAEEINIRSFYKNKQTQRPTKTIDFLKFPRLFKEYCQARQPRYQIERPYEGAFEGQTKKKRDVITGVQAGVLWDGHFLSALRGNWIELYFDIPVVWSVLLSKIHSRISERHAFKFSLDTKMLPPPRGWGQRVIFY